MAKVKILQYGLAWSDRGNGGRITLSLEGGVQKDVQIKDAAEFIAISEVLGRGIPHLVDDDFIVCGWVTP